jgi:hypothetical protein
LYAPGPGQSIELQLYFLLTVIKPATPLHHIRSVSALHHALQEPPPLHPLVSVTDLRQMQARTAQTISYNFYTIALKKLDGGHLRYGPQHYDSPLDYRLSVS